MKNCIKVINNECMECDFGYIKTKDNQCVLNDIDFYGSYDLLNEPLCLLCYPG